MTGSGTGLAAAIFTHHNYYGRGYYSTVTVVSSTCGTANPLNISEPAARRSTRHLGQQNKSGREDARVRPSP